MTSLIIKPELKPGWLLYGMQLIGTIDVPVAEGIDEWLRDHECVFHDAMEEISAKGKSVYVSFPGEDLFLLFSIKYGYMIKSTPVA